MDNKTTNDSNTNKNSLNVIDIDNKRQNFIYDDSYIRNIIENPARGKTKALVKAGYTGEYAAQKAHVMHKRLKSKISQALLEQMEDSKLVGHSVIRDIAVNGDTSASRLSAACRLLDYAGLKPTDKLEITEHTTAAEIDAEIKNTLQRIDDLEKQA